MAVLVSSPHDSSAPRGVTGQPPSTIGCGRAKLPDDQVGGPRRCLIREHGTNGLAADDAADAEVTHEALNGATGYLDAFAPQLRLDLVGSIHATVLVPDARDLRFELLVTQASC
jgi:hypothetical protein